MFFRALLILIAFQVVYGKECLIDEIHPECYKHCYNSVKPVMSYLPLMQKRLDTCENRIPPFAQDSLEKIVNQLDQQLSLTELWQTRLDECESVQDKLTKFLEDYNQNLAPIQLKLMHMEEQFKKQVEKVEICEANAKVTKSILDNQQSLFKKCQKKIKMWRKIGTKYYYIENDETQNWSGALQRCTELGGHLASLQSEEEWNNLRKELRGQSYWLDVNDIEDEGIFKSATTGQLATFLNWHNGEPSGYSLFTNALENCVELRNNHNYFFNDRNCENLISFICEKDAESIDTME